MFDMDGFVGRSVPLTSGMGFGTSVPVLSGMGFARDVTSEYNRPAPNAPAYTGSEFGRTLGSVLNMIKPAYPQAQYPQAQYPQAQYGNNFYSSQAPQAQPSMPAPMAAPAPNMGGNQVGGATLGGFASVPTFSLDRGY